MFLSLFNSVLSAIGGWAVCRPSTRRVVGLFSLKCTKIRDLYPVWLGKLEAGISLRRTPRGQPIARKAGARKAGASPEPAPQPSRPFYPGENMAREAAEAAARAKAADAASLRAEMAIARKNGWLLGLMKHEAAFGATAFAEWLATEEVVRLALACPAFVRRMIPVCRAFGVDTRLLRYPGGMAVPPRRRRAARPRMTPEERWLAALARDPHPDVRHRNYPEDKTAFGWPSRVEMRPKGSVFREHPRWRAEREARRRRQWECAEAARATRSEG